MTGVLALVGGPDHPVDATADALSTLLGPGTEFIDDVDEALRRLDPERHRLLVVNALAFEMSDERYDDVRARDAFHLDDAGREAIERWIGAGRPLLALHTAVICFGEWPRWAEIVGGRWVWGRSWHPPIGSVTVDVAGSEERFTVVDERYTDLAVGGDVELLATSDDQPVAWRHVVGPARVACCTLGHDARSYAVAGHEHLLRSMLAWLLEVPCPT